MVTDSRFIYCWDMDLAHRCAKAYGRVIEEEVVQAARTCGYSISIHGSQIRDIDLVATPWIEEAVSAEELVEAIREACTGYIREDKEDPFPRRKPHGRLCWAIHLGGGPYLDLSVMPRITPSSGDKAN